MNSFDMLSQMILVRRLLSFLFCHFVMNCLDMLCQVKILTGCIVAFVTFIVFDFVMNSFDMNCQHVF